MEKNKRREQGRRGQEKTVEQSFVHESREQKKVGTRK